MLTLLPLLSIPALTAASPAPAPLPEPVHMALSHMPESAHAKRDGAGQVLAGLTFNMWYGLNITNLIVPVYMGYGSGPTNLVLGSFADSSPRAISLLGSSSWFSSNESSSFQESSETLPLAQGSNLTATIAHDVVALNGITLPKQKILMAKGDDLANWVGPNPYVGVVGIEPKGEFATDLLQGRSPEIGLFLTTKDKNMSNGAMPPFYDLNAGHLSVGGLNQQLYTGDVNYFPVVNASEWQVALGGIKVDGKAVDAGTSTTAVLQTSSSMWMRESLANATMAQVPGANYTVMELPGTMAVPNITIYRVPCDTNATITFTFGGKDYPMLPEAWMIGSDYPDEECTANISPIPDEDATVDVGLGYPFLSSVYTAFKFDDAPQIGLASLSDAARGVVPESSEGDTKPTGNIPGHSVLPQPTAGQSTPNQPSGAPAAVRASGLAIALILSAIFVAV